MLSLIHICAEGEEEIPRQCQSQDDIKEDPAVLLRKFPVFIFFADSIDVDNHNRTHKNHHYAPKVDKFQQPHLQRVRQQVGAHHDIGDRAEKRGRDQMCIRDRPGATLCAAP